tara:strand:- start:347 stop:1138 length:792 start_codon:yes stop_codon:yes gene_type:complete
MSEKSSTVSLSDNEKYLEKIREFYILKKKYDKYKESIKKKIIDSDNPIQIKKQILAKTKYKCINCKNEGGTIFEITENNLKAYCGNINSPCNININIEKKKFSNLKEDLINIENIISQKKKEIIFSKLNYLFKYIEEDKAVENFELLKKELSELQLRYNSLLEKYVFIFNNKENNTTLEELLLQQNMFINEFKDTLEVYYSTKENKYLKNAITSYINNIIGVDEKILNLQYKYNAIEKDIDSDYKYLIQNDYLQTDLEILIKS